MATRITQSLDYFKTEGFFKWRLRVGEREANAVGKRSAGIGTRIDEIVKSGVYELTKKDAKKPRLVNCFNAFMKWRERYQVGTLLKMERMTDTTLDLSGEPDLFWVEEETLIDVKGTKDIWPHHFFQLGGYRRLGVPCRKVAILRLDPDGCGPEYITNEKLGLSLEDLVDAYESAFKHYRYYTHIENIIKGDGNGYSGITEVGSDIGAVGF